MGFNTQPPEGGWFPRTGRSTTTRSFNTQPPEGGWNDKTAQNPIKNGFQHTAARRRLAAIPEIARRPLPFQHTAARRRLVVFKVPRFRRTGVSTHSRPKAAGLASLPFAASCRCFNTQPPEGGWGYAILFLQRMTCFNTQPPEGGWPTSQIRSRLPAGFNTQPPEGGWDRPIVCVIRS